MPAAELEVEWHPVNGLSISQYAVFVEGYYTSTLLDSNNVDYNGRPLSVPKWSYGGDVSYGFNVGDFRVTAESNYSFHDTYSQFYLLGSNDFTIPKYWLANANLSLSPASGGPWTVGLWGPQYLQSELRCDPKLLPADRRSRAGRVARDLRHSRQLQVLRSS